MEVTLSAPKTVTENHLENSLQKQFISGLKHGSAARILAPAPLNSTIFRRHCARAHARVCRGLATPLFPPSLSPIGTPCLFHVFNNKWEFPNSENSFPFPIPSFLASEVNGLVTASVCEEWVSCVSIDCRCVLPILVVYFVGVLLAFAIETELRPSGVTLSLLRNVVVSLSHYVLCSYGLSVFWCTVPQWNELWN